MCKQIVNMGNLSALTDDELISLLNESNEKAFNEVYRRYWQKLLAQAMYELKNETEAEECVQDIFIRIWKNRCSLSLEHKLSTYLYRAVKNQVINIHHRNYALRNKLEYYSVNQNNLFEPSADSALIEKELIAELEAAIDALPSKCSSVYRLRRVENKTTEEIASQLGIAQKTVEGHMTRALKRLGDSFSHTPVTILSFILLHLIR